MLRLIVSIGCLVILSGCYTTHYTLKQNPGNRTDTAKAEISIFSPSPVDLKSHCNDGNVAAVGIAMADMGDWFFSRRTITLTCAEDGALPKMKRKKKRRKKRSRKQPNG